MWIIQLPLRVRITWRHFSAIRGLTGVAREAGSAPRRKDHLNINGLRCLHLHSLRVLPPHHHHHTLLCRQRQEPAASAPSTKERRLEEQRRDTTLGTMGSPVGPPSAGAAMDYLLLLLEDPRLFIGRIPPSYLIAAALVNTTTALIGVLSSVGA